VNRGLLAAAAAIALSGTAYATPKHTWFELSYARGRCDHARGSPDELYKASQSWPGFVLERIPPENVTKDANGDIHVRIDGKQKGQSIHYDFFTTLKACDQFITDNGIKPQEADTDDIN
jgi:hypothetical protein